MDAIFSYSQIQQWISLLWFSEIQCSAAYSALEKNITVTKLDMFHFYRKKVKLYSILIDIGLNPYLPNRQFIYMQVESEMHANDMKYATSMAFWD